MPLWDDTRDTWHARPPTQALTAVAPRARVGRTWHWAGPPTHLFGKPHSACLAMVRGWQLFHQTDPDRLWKDIGYNGLICVHARAIEGRGVGVSASHSPSWNTSRWGFQFMVGTGETVTPAMLARGAQLAADVEALAGHDLDDKCHHDDPKTHTECPGPQLHAWVRAGGPEHTTPTQPVEDTVNSTDIEAIADEILTRPATDSTGKQRTVGFALGATLRNTERHSLQLEALTAAVEALATSKGADSAAIVAEVGAAVRERLARLSVIDQPAQ